MHTHTVHKILALNTIPPKKPLIYNGLCYAGASASVFATLFPGIRLCNQLAVAPQLTLRSIIWDLQKTPKYGFTMQNTTRVYSGAKIGSFQVGQSRLLDFFIAKGIVNALPEIWPKGIKDAFGFGIAATLRTTISYPFDHISTRESLGLQSPLQSKNPYQSVNYFYQQHGFRKLYAGVSASTTRAVISRMCLPLSEEINRRIENPLLAGALSGLTLQLLMTYPQTVKTHMQNAPPDVRPKFLTTAKTVFQEIKQNPIAFGRLTGLATSLRIISAAGTYSLYNYFKQND